MSFFPQKFCVLQILLTHFYPTARLNMVSNFKLLLSNYVRRWSLHTFSHIIICRFLAHVLFFFSSKLFLWLFCGILNVNIIHHVLPTYVTSFLTCFLLQLLWLLLKYCLNILSMGKFFYYIVLGKYFFPWRILFSFLMFNGFKCLF